MNVETSYTEVSDCDLDHCLLLQTTSDSSMAGLNNDLIASYLSTHRQFVKNWFQENVTASQLKEWMTHKRLMEIFVPTEKKRRESVHSNYSLHRTFSNSFHQYLEKWRQATSERKERRKSVALEQRSKKMEVMLDLIRDVSRELDINKLCHKIIINVSLLTNSERGSIFLMYSKTGPLVSRLFHVFPNQLLEDCLIPEEEQIVVPIGKGAGIASTVAETKEPIMIREVSTDERYNPELDRKKGNVTKSILCMPILNYYNELLGVAQISNKQGFDNPAFTKEDMEVFQNYLTFCGIGLNNAQLFSSSVERYERNEMLLDLAQDLFSQQKHLDRLMEIIMSKAQAMLHFQRCNVFLADTSKQLNQFKSKLQKPINLTGEKSEVSVSDTEVIFERVYQLKIGKQGDQGNVKNLEVGDFEEAGTFTAANRVAKSLEMINTENAGIQDYDNYKVKTFLCIPILDYKKNCIGVFQLLNKCSGKAFSSSDAMLLEAFTIFCGLSIHNCDLYESVTLMTLKQKVAMDVVAYHSQASVEDTEKLLAFPRPDAKEIRLYEYDFSDFELNDMQTCAAARLIFEESEVNKLFHIPDTVLCRWLLSVKKNYRNVIYHNWRHALNVAQTMYTMLHTSMLHRMFKPLEIFTLLVACLCHDLDHRGTNNSFQVSVDSAIAKMYSSSTMEHHHFDQCVMILNCEGNNIFESLSLDQYQRALTMVQENILATDLALYFKKKATFLEKVHKLDTEWDNPENKQLLRSMMVTACDISGITKPWEVQQHIADLVSSEFFEQGDLERDILHKDPIAMMDRRKKEELPKQQLGFINFVCLPLFKGLADFEPLLSPLLDGLLNNKNEWQKLADIANNKPPHEARKYKKQRESKICNVA